MLKKLLNSYEEISLEYQKLSAEVEKKLAELLANSKLTRETKYFSASTPSEEISKEYYEELMLRARSASKRPKRVYGVPIKVPTGFEVLSTNFTYINSDTIKETTTIRNEQGVELTQLATHHINKDSVHQLELEGYFFKNPNLTMIVGNSQYQLVSKNKKSCIFTELLTQEELFSLVFPNDFNVDEIEEEDETFVRYGGEEDPVNILMKLGILPENPNDILESLGITKDVFANLTMVKFLPSIAREVNNRKFEIFLTISGVEDSIKSAKYKDQVTMGHVSQIGVMHLSLTVYEPEIDRWLDTKLCTLIKIDLTSHDFKGAYQRLAKLYK